MSRFQYTFNSYFHSYSSRTFSNTLTFETQKKKYYEIDSRGFRNIFSCRSNSIILNVKTWRIMFKANRFRPWKRYSTVITWTMWRNEFVIRTRSLLSRFIHFIRWFVYTYIRTLYNDQAFFSQDQEPVVHIRRNLFTRVLIIMLRPARRAHGPSTTKSYSLLRILLHLLLTFTVFWEFRIA